MPMKCYWNDKLVYGEELRWHIQNTSGFTDQAIYKYFCDADGGCRNFDNSIFEGALLHTWSLKDQRPISSRKYCNNACRQAAYHDRVKANRPTPELQTCARDGCETTFVWVSRGSKQKFCSPYCRQRYHQLKRKQNSQE